MATPNNPLHEEKQKVGQHSSVDPDTSRPEGTPDEMAVGDDIGEPLRRGKDHPTGEGDDEPQEPDLKTRHGELSEAQKGSQPGLTGHVKEGGADRNEGHPLRSPQESGQSALDE
jgi:hypothetical protein